MTKQVLICEDTQQVVSVLKRSFQELVEDKHQDSLEIESLHTSQAVRQLNTHLHEREFDLVLLDYFAPDGSFHVLDIEEIGPQKVIAISSMPGKNQLAIERGVKYSIAKKNRLTDENLSEIIRFAEYILYSK